MSERSDPIRDAQRLVADARRISAEFLLTEVHIGLSLLDAIDASADRDKDERRLSVALEAYGVVTERLARTGAQAVVLTRAERREITRLLVELRAWLECDTKRGRG